ncbi:MAG: 23S rRNA (adenine(2503)-C(2))-methyltransferase RlmN [Saprospiraceae bacterium]|uniref:Probable dual-specificity RNA methyltransferase RlmN n=1 Tax=Candidatus Opimibacter skivensis TaxID=2982028 RepID=A0A9D7SX50_9BACT|nr:23S rRNA (adenine(2503)-C(2))-methyltransferase RlmN [Candidatus Opimibacter skivensis]
MAALPDIRTLSLADLQKSFVEIGQPAYRAQQVYDWMWKLGAKKFDDMSNVPAALRKSLHEHYTFHSIETDVRQSSADGTIKTRYTLHDGKKIETVMIPVERDKRYTACVSSQVGCSLTCSFCATGQMGRIRNLTGAEIYDQAFDTNKLCEETLGSPLTNIVYMGMGEPLLNYGPVMESIAKITGSDGMSWSPRRITVSTAGIAKMITRLADEQVKFNLALSLHAADDQKRSRIMPINETNHLSALMEALDYFYKKTHGRISFEYIALKGFNDGLDDADKLIKLCRGQFPVKVNVIEYNPVPGVAFEKADESQIDKFAKKVRDKGVMITVRRSRGKDIDAACGQLANQT